MDKKKSWLLPVLGVVTFCWVFIAMWLLIRPEACSLFHEPTLAINCLSLNELGDFLAGAFAPLAFIWLAAAVFIQAKELRAQRNELALTRDELKLARKVAVQQTEATNAQALEARRSAGHFEVQTRILEDEQRTRHEAEAKEVLDVLYVRLSETDISYNGEIKCFKNGDRIGSFSISFLANEAKINEYCKVLNSWKDSYGSSCIVSYSHLSIKMVTERNKIFKEINELRGRLSKADQRRIEDIPNVEQLNNWDEFLATLDSMNTGAW